VKRAVAIALVAAAAGAAIAAGLARRGRDEGARCSPGFTATGARCLVEAGTCPAPLVLSRGECDAPDVRVLVPVAIVRLGSDDWEATGVDSPSSRTVEVPAFRIDAFEVTQGHWGSASKGDAARAASGMTRAEAETFCAARGGRLPTESEWVAAAVSASDPPRRYPWGDTGAVCRRAAWGLSRGPCATGADGPDTVGAHGDGDSPLGIHDLAGNVAEWVVPEDPGKGTARGGSYESALASDLRVWARLEVSPSARDVQVGLRCAYPP
jgi:formylglycine-generating enzyme required for sulfatase activity